MSCWYRFSNRNNRKGFKMIASISLQIYLCFYAEIYTINVVVELDYDICSHNVFSYWFFFTNGKECTVKITWACASMVVVMGETSVVHNAICEIKTFHLQRYQYAWGEVWGMPGVLRVLACSLMPLAPCARRSRVTVRQVSMLFIYDKTR